MMWHGLPVLLAKDSTRKMQPKESTATGQPTSAATNGPRISSLLQFNFVHDILAKVDKQEIIFLMTIWIEATHQKCHQRNKGLYTVALDAQVSSMMASSYTGDFKFWLACTLETRRKKCHTLQTGAWWICLPTSWWGTWEKQSRRTPIKIIWSDIADFPQTDIADFDQTLQFIGIIKTTTLKCHSLFVMIWQGQHVSHCDICVWTWWLLYSRYSFHFHILQWSIYSFLSIWTKILWEICSEAVSKGNHSSNIKRTEISNNIRRVIKKQRPSHVDIFPLHNAFVCQTQW